MCMDGPGQIVQWLAVGLIKRKTPGTAKAA